MILRPGVRHRLVILLAFALAAALSSCGGGSDADTSAKTGGGSSVEVEHRFGTTEVPTGPERIVTLDLQWTDTVLAMGGNVVGHGADPLMPQGRAPWWPEDLTGKALNLADGVPIEKIAALEPDLIVATFSIGDEKTYDLLSQIAPTVAGPSENYVAGWQELLDTAGTFMADEAKARDVVDRVEAKIERVTHEFPQLDGKTFALAQYIVGDAIYVVGDPGDGSSKVFRQLGMTLLPAVVEQSKKTNQARIKISAERTDLLTADFLGFLVNGGDDSDLEDIPGFDQLPASESGAAAVLDYSTIAGLNTPTPLSVPYVLERLEPYLKNVA